MAAATLIVCYDFPPNEGIGGRRWAKLAAALAGRGCEIHVIKADPRPGNTESPWTSETKHPGIHVHSLPRTYPSALSHPGSSLKDKLQHRFWKWWFRKRYQGTIYDLAINWKDTWLSKAGELIRSKGIRNVIITGAPFNLFIQAAELKELHPEIKLILDYRDPWLTAVNYGIPQLSYRNFLQEKFKQHRALKAADLICAPAERMLAELRASDDELCPLQKWHYLPHFYDPEDLKATPAEKENDSIVICYGGSLYIGLEPYFASFNKGLDKLREQDPALYKRLRIKIFSKDLQYRHWFSSHPEVYSIQPGIGKALFGEIASADAVFILLAEHNKHYQTTKFFETLPFRKPLIYLGAAGTTAQWIQNNRLGVILDSPESQVINVITQLSEAHLPFATDFPIENYTTAKLAEKVEGWLQ